MELFVVLAVAALLGLLPATIEKDKGYNFGLWWFYGCMLFVVAIMHVHIIPDNTNTITGYSSASIPYLPPSQLTAADEIKHYKK